MFVRAVSDMWSVPNTTSWAIPFMQVGEIPLGAGPAPQVGKSKTDSLISVPRKLVSIAATPLLVYHGYKRNHSVGWAILWGLGGLVWPIALPIAFAQGFGKRG